jgi:transposase
MAAAPAGKRPKASLVKQAAIDHTSAFLQALPDKPKEDMSLREAIDQMRDSLKNALSKGYTYQELAAMLTDQGIKISAFTLKNYVPSGRRRSKEQLPVPTTRKTRKSKADQVEAIVAELAREPAPEDLSEASLATVVEPSPTAEETVEKAPVRSRRKSTTAAKAKTDDEATVKQTITKRPVRKPVAKSASSGKSVSAKKPARPSSKSRKKAES